MARHHVPGRDHPVRRPSHDRCRRPPSAYTQGLDAGLRMRDLVLVLADAVDDDDVVVVPSGTRVIVRGA